MDNNEEPISRLTSIKRLSAAYKSMYEPKVEEPEEIETTSEEDENVAPT
tara:strand:+ start:391 stop:537 length:147 start_codon:yes stop_codon:yes gene_type:complete